MLTLSDLRTVPQAVLELLVVLQPLPGAATYEWLSQALRVGRAAVYARVLAARRLQLVQVKGDGEGGSHRGGRGRRQVVALTPAGRRIVEGAGGNPTPPPARQ